MSKLIRAARAAEKALELETEWRQQAEECMRGYAEEASELRVRCEALEGAIREALGSLSDSARMRLACQPAAGQFYSTNARSLWSMKQLLSEQPEEALADAFGAAVAQADLLAENERLRKDNKDLVEEKLTWLAGEQR